MKSVKKVVSSILVAALVVLSPGIEPYRAWGMSLQDKGAPEHGITPIKPVVGELGGLHSLPQPKPTEGAKVGEAPKISEAPAAAPKEAPAKPDGNAPAAPVGPRGPSAAGITEVESPATPAEPPKDLEQVKRESGEKFEKLAPRLGEAAASADASLSKEHGKPGGARLAAPSGDAASSKSEPPAPLSHNLAFKALMHTHFWSALSDTTLKMLFVEFVTHTLSPRQAGFYIGFAMAAFVVPYIFFSAFAGRLADREDKAKIVQALKWAELGIIVASAGAFTLAGAHPAVPALAGLIGLLALMGSHSAFMSPAKETLLGQLIPHSQKAEAKGAWGAATFVAIILGSALATGLYALPVALGLKAAALLAITALGIRSSRGLPLASAWSGGLSAVKAALAQLGRDMRDHARNWWATTKADLREISSSKPLFLTALAQAYFWFVGGVVQQNLPLFAQLQLTVGDGLKGLTGLLTIMALGIGVGNKVAGGLSKGRVELGLVPIGAAMMGASLFLLTHLGAGALAAAFSSLFILGLGAGLFLAPLEANFLVESDGASQGRLIATNNFIIFTGLAFNGVLYGLAAAAGMSPAAIFFGAGALTLGVTALIFRRLSAQFAHFMILSLINVVYRVQKHGEENIPAQGPVMIIPNHMSYADALWLYTAFKREVWPVMYSKIYARAQRFFDLFHAIPIASSPPKELARSIIRVVEVLKKGGAILLFGEGEISRHGGLQEIKPGFERMAEKAMQQGSGDVLMVPAYIGRAWGSLFSNSQGHFGLKWPIRVPYVVSLWFGKPLKAPVPAWRMRQEIEELSAEDSELAVKTQPTLALQFLRSAKRHWFKFASADPVTGDMTYGRLLTASVLWNRRLKERLTAAPNVGVLLPPSNAARLANMALTIGGKVPVNLNYSLKESLPAALRIAGIEKIVTSRAFISKLGLEPTGSMIFVEDLKDGIGKWEAAKTYARLLLTPSWLLERKDFKSASRNLDDTATLIFSSGSTSEPKAIMLSHKNIIANVESIRLAYDFRPGDRILGVAPIFHSLGFTATLWLPLMAGMGVVQHANPMDSEKLASLVKDYRATVLLATPKMLQMYAHSRKTEADDFLSLRYVIAGAEKLDADVRDGFKLKFGKEVYEGYGTTELSPAATANIADFTDGDIVQQGNRPGSVGRPLPGVAVRVVDPETFELLPPGKEGLILVKGANVMKGYYGRPDLTAEIVKDGWYVTGDIGRRDDDGFLYITDRLSEFTKVAGEMVSNGAVAEKINAAAQTPSGTFVVTGVRDAKRGERLVVLYTGAFQGELDELYAKLRKSGLPNLWLPGKESFHRVSAIPMLGSGKKDLKAVKKLAQALEAARDAKG